MQTYTAALKLLALQDTVSAVLAAAILAQLEARAPAVMIKIGRAS